MSIDSERCFSVLEFTINRLDKLIWSQDESCLPEEDFAGDPTSRDPLVQQLLQTVHNLSSLVWDAMGGTTRIARIEVENTDESLQITMQDLSDPPFHLTVGMNDETPELSSGFVWLLRSLSEFYDQHWASDVGDPNTRQFLTALRNAIQLIHTGLRNGGPHFMRIEITRDPTGVLQIDTVSGPFH